LVRAFPDLHIEVTRTVVQDQAVASLCRVIGTHTGDGLGPPTKKKIDFWGLVLIDTASGKLQEAWNFFDFPTMYRQIGRPQDLR
jgi:predicted ester cyclase